MRKFKKLIAVLSALVLLCTTFAGTGIFASAADAALTAFQNAMAQKETLTAGTIVEIKDTDYWLGMVRTKDGPNGAVFSDPVVAFESWHNIVNAAAYPNANNNLGDLFGFRNEDCVSHTSASNGWLGTSVVYNVVPGTYVATVLNMDPDHTWDTGIEGGFRFEVSANGAEWTVVSPTVKNITAWAPTQQLSHGTAVLQIPEGAKYYRITMRDFNDTISTNLWDQVLWTPQTFQSNPYATGFNGYGIGMSIVSNDNLNNVTHYSEISDIVSPDVDAFQEEMAKKAVLKPGNMDDISTDDYVYTMVRSRTLPDVSLPEADHLAKHTAPVYNDRGTWYEVMKYPMGGILGLRNEHIITHAGPGIAWGGHAVVYNVVENSYVATSVILHPDYAANLELATMFKDYFGYEVSSDGKLWTAVTPNITNVTGWSTNNQVAYAQATVKIPEGMKYYRITLPPYSKTAMGNTLRVDNGYAIPNIDMLVESTVGLVCAGVGASVASNYNLANYSKYEDIPGDYSVTLPEGVTADKTASLKKGDVVTLTVDESKYFAVSSLKYSYKYADNTITKTIFAKGDTDFVGEGSGNVFKFAMPDSSVDVSIKFLEKTESTFEDNIGIVATSVNKQKRAQRYMTRVYLEDGMIRVGENLYKPRGYGMVFLPEQLLADGEELTRETADVLDVPVQFLYDKTEKYIDFVCGVKGMSEALQQKKLVARAYVKYSANKQDYYVYIDSPSTVSYEDINGSTTAPYFELTSLSECNFLNEDNEYAVTPEISWTELTGANSYNLTIKKLRTDGTTKTVLDVKGIEGTSYDETPVLEANMSYLCTVSAEFVGKTYYANDDKEGFLFLADYNAETHPSNKGLDFTFGNGVLPTEQILRNYLSRSMTCGIFDDYIDRDMKHFEENLRMILNTGAKYIQRSTADSVYVVSKANDALVERNSKLIEKVHEIDPEIIFEGCVFETANANMNEYEIPKYVFDAFGLTYEKRNFDYTRMLYDDGHNNLGSYHHPDMSKTETQMWWYYRATWLIDQGYEAIHLGSTPCMSDVDINNGYSGWYRVCTLIREYAKTHARRGYAFLNAHQIDMRYRKNSYSSYNHVLDFNMWMTCAEVPAGETEGAPTEDNPQELEIKTGVTNAIYGKTQSAKHPLGFTTKAIFLVELDNYGINYDNYNKPTSNGGTYPWGIDEIGWFNQQPDWYRHQWVEYAYNRVREIDSYGYFSVPGIRAASLLNSPLMYYYRANSKLSCYGDKVKGDEFAIRKTWAGVEEDVVILDQILDQDKDNFADPSTNW